MAEKNNNNNEKNFTQTWECAKAKLKEIGDCLKDSRDSYLVLIVFIAIFFLIGIVVEALTIASINPDGTCNATATSETRQAAWIIAVIALVGSIIGFLVTVIYGSKLDQELFGKNEAEKVENK
jgi:membrane protein YqaA with SNARE-associated domain